MTCLGSEVKRGDLVRFEYLMRHNSGVGWSFHKGIGIVVGYSTKTDSYRIMIAGGKILERLDMQLDLIMAS